MAEARGGIAAVGPGNQDTEMREAYGLSESVSRFSAGAVNMEGQCVARCLCLPDAIEKVGNVYMVSQAIPAGVLRMSHAWSELPMPS